MAVIDSGLLIGLRRSVGGQTFQRRRGTQLIKNKPTRAATYVPSSMQQFFQDLYSELNVFAKSRVQMQSLIRDGWGGLKRRQGASNLNNFLGYMIRLMTRTNGGGRLDFEAVVANRTEFNEHPFYYWLKTGDMTKSPFPIYFGRVTTEGTDTSYTIKIPENDFRAWVDSVSKISPRYSRDSGYFFVKGQAEKRRPASAGIEYVPAVLLDGFYSITFTFLDEPYVALQLALAAAPTAFVADSGEPAYAVSPIVWRWRFP